MKPENDSYLLFNSLINSLLLFKQQPHPYASRPKHLRKQASKVTLNSPIAVALTLTPFGGQTQLQP